MRLRGAIFDMDGTLLDSMGAWKEAGERLFRELNITLTPDDNEKIAIMPVSESMQYLRDKYNLAPSAEEMGERINGFLLDFYASDARPKPGAIAFLNALRARGVKMCVLTASDSALARAAFEHLHMMDYFEFIMSTEDENMGKDEPDIFLRALKKLGTRMDETYVFEDAIYAASTAKSAGFPVGAVYEERLSEDWDALRALADTSAQTLDGLGEIE